MKTRSIILALCVLAPLSGYCSAIPIPEPQWGKPETIEAQKELQSDQLSELKEIHAAIETNNELLKALLSIELKNGLNSQTQHK